MDQCQLKVSEKYRRISMKMLGDETNYVTYGYFHGWHNSYAIRSTVRGFQAHAIVEMADGNIRVLDTFEYSFKFVDPIQ